MLAASSWSVSSLNARRGCSGFDSMRSTGITLTLVDRRPASGESRLTIAGGSPPSSESRRAAAARNSVLAKVDHLPGESAIGAGRLGRRRVRRDRPADEWGLAKLHGLANDGAEDMMVSDDPELIEHVLREVGAGVIEGGEQAEDPEVVVQLEPDRVDDLHQVVEALHRVELRLDRDDHAVRGDEPVDGEQPEVRGAVDERVVIAVRARSHCLAKYRFATERGEQLAPGAREVDVGGRDVDPGALGGSHDLVARRP